MSGLTPQMLAAIQQAGQAGAGVAGSHGTASGIDSAMENALAQSGLFNPQQLQAVNSQFVGGSTPWGNGAPETSSWEQMMQQALQGVQGNTDAVSANQQPVNPAIASASNPGGYNPLQPAYLPQPGQLNATTVNPSYLNQNLLNSLGSGQTINALVGANQPQFQQQDQQMMQMMATAGLTPSSTAGQTAFNNLAQQQLAGMDPSIAAAIQNSQGNMLNAGQFNANTANTGNAFNANAMNQAAGTNLQNQNAQQQYNANAYNNAGQNYFNAMTGAYNNNANAFNALNGAGLAGSQNLAGGQQSGGYGLAGGTQNTFPVYGSGGTGYGALGQAVGQGTGTNRPTTTMNPYASNSAGYGFQGAGDAGYVSDAGV